MSEYVDVQNGHRLCFSQNLCNRHGRQVPTLLQNLDNVNKHYQCLSIIQQFFFNNIPPIFDSQNRNGRSGPFQFAACARLVLMLVCNVADRCTDRTEKTWKKIFGPFLLLCRSRSRSCFHLSHFRARAIAPRVSKSRNGHYIDCSDITPFLKFVNTNVEFTIVFLYFEQDRLFLSWDSNMCFPVILNPDSKQSGKQWNN